MFRRDTITFNTTTDDLNSLYQAVNNRRKGSKNIVVDAEMLFRVLQDHATMSDSFNDGGSTQ